MQGFVEFREQFRTDDLALNGAGTMGVLDQIVASGLLWPCDDV
jgi:hypothetical protein